MDRGALWTTVHGVTKVGHDQATFMSLHPKLHESKDHICFVFITESLMLSIRLVVQMVVGLMDEWMNVWTSIKNVFISYCIIFHIQLFSSDQFSSVAQSCLTLCDPMNRSTPGLPVHHQLPESTQTQVHRVGDAIQPSHPLSSPSPRAPNPSQHHSLFQWVNSSHGVAKVLEFQL